MHETDNGDGSLFDVGLFTQRIVRVDGPRGSAVRHQVLYVLEGTGEASIEGETLLLRPGDIAVHQPRHGLERRGARGRAVSVLVHDPSPASATMRCST